MQRADKVYEFGPYRLEVRKNRLFGEGRPIPIRRKTYEILLVLLDSAGELVEKDEILERVWPGLIIEESNLAQHISTLRKLLGDSSKDQQYILTVPGKGYIFIQNVQVRYEDDESRLVSPSVTPSGDGEDGEVAGPDQATRTAQVESAPRGWRRPAAWIASVLLVGLCLSTIFIWWRWRQEADLAANVPRVTAFVTLPGLESHPAFSPDGRYLAFASEGETRQNQDIYVRMVEQDVMWQVTSHPDLDSHVTWSPDGAQLAFLRNSGQYTTKYKLMIVPVRGGMEQEIAEVWGGLDWSPDGKYLAVSDYEGLGTPTGLYLISPDGKERRHLTTPVINYYDTTPRFSPDGGRIAFLRWRVNGNSDIFVVTLATGDVRQLTNDQKRVADLQWGPGGKELYFISNRKENNRLWRIPAEGGEPFFMALAPVDLESMAISPLTTAPDSPGGEIIAYTQSLTDTVIDLFKVAEVGLSLPRPACSINSSRGDDTPRFSPDGSQVAFVSTRTGWEEIWVAKSDCANPTQLTHFNQLGVGSPRWSPDGERIVFDRNVDGNTDIFTIRANGTEVRQLTFDKTIDNMPTWSANGEWIYFSSYKTSMSQIYRLPAAGGEPVLVTTSLGREPRESADGQSLYYTSRDRLWRKDLRSGREAVVPELANVPIGRYWDIAGSTLYYISQQPGEKPIIRTLDLESRRSASLFELPGSLARWVPGISFQPSQNLLAAGYVANRFGDISLIRGLLK